MTDNPTRDASMNAALEGWVNIDPKAALDFSMNSGNTKPDDITRRVTAWASNDPTSALAWAKGLSDSPAKNSAIAGAVGGLALTDPERAMPLVTPQLLGSISDDARRALGNIIASKLEPTNAADWASKLADPLARESAYRTTGETWAKADPVAAAAWLEKLPEGQDRDWSTASYARVVQSTDPEGAAAWASTIRDPREREGVITDVTRNWLNSDKKAATAWLQATTALSPEAKARLLPK